MITKTTRLNITIIICYILALTQPLFSQIQPVEDFHIGFEEYRGVWGGKSERLWSTVLDSITVNYEGYYRMLAYLDYDSGDEQLNESCFFTIASDTDTLITPLDPNAGDYKVIPDDPGEPHFAWRDAGLFYLKQGINRIVMSHYKLIANQYPKYVIGDGIDGPESVGVDSLQILAAPLMDGAIKVRAAVTRDTQNEQIPLGYIFPGETVHYNIIISDEYGNEIRHPQVENILPIPLTSLEFDYEPEKIDSTTIRWKLPHIAANDSFVISFSGVLPEQEFDAIMPLTDHATLFVLNDIDSSNNTASATIEAISNNIIEQLRPKITATPATVYEKDSISLSVMIPAGTTEWDLWIYLADTTIIKTFADDFIESHTLVPNIWHEIDEPYIHQKLLTGDLQEPVIFQITSKDSNDFVLSARAEVDVLKILKVDGAVELSATINHNEASSPENMVFPSEKVDYEIVIRNQGEDVMMGAELENLLPDRLDSWEFKLQPKQITDKTIRWQLPDIASNDSFIIAFSGILPTQSFDGVIPLTDNATLFAPNDTDNSNNTDSVKIYAVSNLNILNPQIKAIPPLSYVDHGIQVSVQLPEGTESWDLYVHRADGSTLKTFADNFISGTTLTFDVWHNIPELYIPGQMFSSNEQEPVTFEIIKTDKYGFELSASTTVEVTDKLDIFMPKIKTSVSQIDVIDSVRVYVQIPVGTASWDLWVYLPDGSIDKSFGDDFIAATLLTPDTWYEIDELFKPEKLVTTMKKEQFTFEIRKQDVLGIELSADADVEVKSSNYLVLDRNVFKPELEDAIGIKFKLSNRRLAQLDIYDISGKHIVKLTEAVYEGGWNVYPWDGMSDASQKIGSGVYLVTLRSGEFNSWKKFILVR